MNNTAQEVQQKLAAIIEKEPMTVAYVQGYIQGYEAAKAQAEKQSA